MTPITTPERADLEARIKEAERAHRLQVSIWEAMARPIRERIERAADEWDATGQTWHLKALHIARRDLSDLGPAPVEPISLGLLRGRLHRITEGLR